MGMNATRTELLAAVERSPQAAGSHDRADWVGLFTADGCIEDPVGSRAHRGRAEGDHLPPQHRRRLGFDRHPRRDARGSDGAVGHDADPRLPPVRRRRRTENCSAASVWELPTMAWQFARNGVGAVPAGAQLSRALLRNQGLSATVGFLSGIGGAVRAKRQLAGLLDDACAGDQVAVKRRLADAAQITRVDATWIPSYELVALLHGARWNGMLRAGYSSSQDWSTPDVLSSSSARSRHVRHRAGGAGWAIRRGSVRYACSPRNRGRETVVEPCLTTTP